MESGDRKSGWGDGARAPREAGRYPPDTMFPVGRHRAWVWSLSVVGLALATRVVVALATDARTEDPPAPPKQTFESRRHPRVLVYTVSAGFEHDVVRRGPAGEWSLVERTMDELGRTSGSFQPVVSREPTVFEPASLAAFDAVFFYTTGELPLTEAQRSSLLAFVRDGGGFVGVHCATDTFYEVPEYGRMVGAYFDGHPWHEKVGVRVERTDHVSTAHLGSTFEIVDEIYQFKAPYERATSCVLLSLDPAGVDGKPLDVTREGVHRADRDFALAWTKPYGRGRVFYTALGHRPEVWSDARFTRHLTGGLRWVTRREERPKLEDRERSLRSRVEDMGPAGDPRRGHEVFRRESGPMCARCHTVNESGGKVGPDLSGIARRLAREEIVDAILAPSSSIEPGYESVSLELADSTVLFGRIVSETDAVISLVETTGLARSIPAKDVVTRRMGSVSVMPNGLATTLTPDEFADLMAYLSTLTVPAAK